MGSSARVRLISILVVEDDADQREIVATALEHDGFTVHTADHAGTALDLLAVHPIHALLTDHGMPGMTGAELIARAREDGLLRSEAPAFLVSAQGEVPVPESCTFLHKPIDLDDLSARLRSIKRDSVRVRAAGASD